MNYGDLLLTIKPDSSIPELINFIRYSLRQCEFDEVQNILMNRENSMKVELENLVRECNSVKKELDLLKKCNVEEKFERMQRRVEDLDKLIVQKEEKIEKLESEKLDHEKKLVRSSRKCKEMDDRLVKMEKEIEELRRENLSANKTIEELKSKEVEAVRVVQELKIKNGEAARTIDELRAKKMEADKAAEVCKSGVIDLTRRISMLEKALAQMLSVNVEDLPTLANDVDNFAASATHNEEDNSLENGQMNSDAEVRVVMSPEVPAASDVRDVAHSEMEEDDAKRVCTDLGSEPASSNSAVAESNATVQDNKDEVPVVRGSLTSVMQSGGEVARENTAVPSSSAAGGGGNVVIVISDSDSDDENMASKKRDRREHKEGSAINWGRKRRRSNSTQPSGLPSSSHVEERQKCRDTVDLVESEDESCSITT